jgi:hypothetical protein
MLATADVFPFWRIAVGALVASGLRFLVLWALQWRLKPAPVSSLQASVPSPSLVHRWTSSH